MNASAMITRLLLLPREPADAARCLRVDPHGRILDARPVEAASPLGAEPGTRTVAIVPGELVGTSWLDLPTRNAMQALAAARILLQDRMAGKGEAVHIAIAPGPAADAPRPVAFVAESRMQAWLEQCGELGVVPDAMLPEQLVMEAPDDIVRIFVHNGAWLVRGPQSAFVAEPDLAMQVVGAQAHELVDDQALVESHFAKAVAVPHDEQLDLLQHAHARAGSHVRPRWRRIAVLAALCLASPLLLLGAQASRDALGTYWLHPRTQAVAGYALGTSIPAGIDVPSALHAHYLERVSPQTLATHAARLFEALGQLGGARLQSLDYDVESGLRAGLLHANEADLEALRQRLAGHRLDVISLESQTIEGGMATKIMLREQL